MSTTEKGDVLELLTLLIERSTSDQSGTVFKKKYKMNDQHGVDREIDLFVTTPVNGKTIQYAFECKNHKKGIALKDIVDFYSKIESRPISGYFVTTGKYQSGAIKKAKALGIQLLTLSKRPPAGEDIETLYIFRKRHEIVNVSYQVYSPDFKDAALDDMLNNCEGCQKALANLFSRFVLPHLRNGIQKVMDIALPDDKNPALPENSGGFNSAVRDIVVEFTPDTTVTHEQKYLIEVNRVVVKVKVWYEKVTTQRIDAEHFIYDTYDGNGNGTLFSKSEFYIEDKKMILCVARPEIENSTQNLLLAEEQSIDQSILLKGHPLDFK